jgi:hypothetical protein
MMILGVLVLTLLVDRMVYSNEVRRLNKSLEESISASIQELNLESEGVFMEFDEVLGENNIIFVEIEYENAKDTFFKMLAMNNLDVEKIKPHTVLMMINPKDTSLEYGLYNKNFDQIVVGSMSSHEELENFINGLIEEDTFKVNVSGNSKTNNFTKNPYVMVFIEKLPVKSAFRDRSYSAYKFSGSRLIRR